MLFWPGAGINSCHMSETDILLISVLFFLKSAGCSIESEAAVAWLWLRCGHEGPLVASSRPSPEHRLALLPHPLVTSPLSILNGGIGGSMYTRCFSWLLLDWFSVWRTFRLPLVPLCQSLNTYGNHSGPVVLVSKHFFQDPGFGEGFLGDFGRFQCVWPSEEIFLLYRGCTAVFGTVEMSCRVSGRETRNVLFSWHLNQTLDTNPLLSISGPG